MVFSLMVLFCNVFVKEIRRSLTKSEELKAEERRRYETGSG